MSAAAVTSERITQVLGEVAGKHRENWHCTSYMRHTHLGCGCLDVDTLPEGWDDMGWMERSDWYRSHLASVQAAALVPILAGLDGAA